MRAENFVILYFVVLCVSESWGWGSDYGNYDSYEAYRPYGAVRWNSYYGDNRREDYLINKDINLWSGNWRDNYNSDQRDDKETGSKKWSDEANKRIDTDQRNWREGDDGNNKGKNNDRDNNEGERSLSDKNGMMNDNSELSNGGKGIRLDNSKIGYEDDDDEKSYYYPCRKYRFEEDCVSRVLASYSQCRLVHRYEQKNQIYRERSVEYFPSFNFTVTHINSRISGLDKGRIDKFYINKKTGNLVYSVDFKVINVDTKDTYFTYYRQGKEPIVTKDFSNVTFIDIYLTAVVPLEYNPSLRDFRVTAYIGNAFPPFVLGPGISNNRDPVVQRSFSALMANVPLGLREAFLTLGHNLFSVYLQNYICDFGVKI